MARKRRGKVDRELIRRALDEARKTSEDSNTSVGADVKALKEFTASSRGACFLTVRGRTGCDIDITEAACNDAAARLGGIATWVENGSCD